MHYYNTVDFKPYDHIKFEKNTFNRSLKLESTILVDKHTKQQSKFYQM